MSKPPEYNPVQITQTKITIYDDYKMITNQPNGLNER